MDNTTISPRSDLQGDCIAPFLDMSRFPLDGGHLEGRFCAPIAQLPGSPTCCLPCPATDWTYSDSFDSYMTVAEWLNVVGLILMSFMLLSYLVLPAQKTRSHYLSVCLIISAIMITLGFTIPLAADPEKCYNEITPNDMYSSTECAWSGAFIIAGALSADMWIFIRALSMNLQICWDIMPGRKFFYFSQAFGWGIPAILFTAAMTVTGVSFRFGRQCDINHEQSMGDFWGPLMAVAAGAGLLQLMTFGYCIRVYLKNLMNDPGATSTSASGSQQLPSYQPSVRTQTARAVWRRLQKVLWLQWRGICIVTIILVDVIFFAVVFVWLDSLQARVKDHFQNVEPWLFCLSLHPTDKNACLNLVGDWLVTQPTVVAAMLILALAGIQTFLLLVRPTFFPAWLEFFGARSGNEQDFVSLDARQETERSASKQETVSYRRGHESTTFEMQRPGNGNSLSLDIDNKGMMSPTSTMLASPNDVYYSPLQTTRNSPGAEVHYRSHPTSPYHNERPRIPLEYVSQQIGEGGPRSPPTPVVRYDAVSLNRQNSDYFSQHRYASPGGMGQRPPSSRSVHSDRRYQAPMTSFSTPQNPSRQSSMRSTNFDPRDTYSRGGLGLNPPSEAIEPHEDLTGYHGTFQSR